MTKLIIFADNNRREVNLGSLNGTLVNKKRIKGEVILHDGDEVAIGSVRCVFRSKEDPYAVVKMVEPVEGALQTYIHSKVAPPAQDKFLPEKTLTTRRCAPTRIVFRGCRCPGQWTGA